MSRTLLALAMAGLGSLVATGLHGQAPARLAPGETVRITDGTGQRKTGMLLAISSDSLTLGNGEQFRAYALADLSGIEKRTGTYMSGRTIFITMGVMALAGGLIGAMTYEPCRDQGFMACFMAPESRVQAFTWGFLGGTVLGLPVGLILTPIVKYSHWEQVMASQDPARVGLGLRVMAPQASARVGLGLKVTIPLPAR